MANKKQRNALVTGGRQGIGRAIVDRFEKAGMTVLTCGRGQRPDDLPPTVEWMQCDVADRDQVAALAARVVDQFGRLDILVNNAGIQIEKTLADTSDADWELLMGVNARGVFLVCRAMLPLIRDGGCILNLGSISATRADPGMALYNASKAFVEGLTRSIAVDHGPSIRCNAISPGWIMTGMADAAFVQARDPTASRKDALRRHPAGRFGLPEDVANLAHWLVSEEAGFVTGQCYVLDGGLTAASPVNPGLF